MSIEITNEERKILTILDPFLRQQSVVQRIDPIAARVEQKLAEDAKGLLTFEPVPLEVYGKGLPEEIQSSWVFVLRANVTTGAERHPNSIQRVMSYRGIGDLQMWDDESWHSHVLVSDFDADIEKRWATVPINVWHKPVVPGANWVVVSFHTVPAEELIEERPESADMKQTRQRRYLDQPQ